MTKLLKAYHLAKRFQQKLEEDSVSVFAAQAAFFIVISFFPFTMLFLTLVNYLPFTVEEVESLSFNILSPSVSGFVNGIVQEIYQKASGAVVSITSITALWSASKSVLAVTRGLNKVYGTPEKRGYLRLRLTAVLYMLVLIVILFVILALLVFGGSINKWLGTIIPDFESFTALFLSLRWLMGFVVLILFFLFLYTVAPERKTRFVTELPGAVLSAVGWVGFSALYSFYIENYSNYSYLYGSITAVVLLMLWLYFCMHILLLGAEVNDMLQDKAYRGEWGELLKGVFKWKVN